MTKDQIKQIAREYHEKGPTKLAELLGFSKQKINQMVSALRKKGVKVLPPPRTTQNKDFYQAIEELKKESPEFFNVKET